MISYFCYFGDEANGINFEKIIFGNTKLIPLMEKKMNIQSKNQAIEKILIRYFLDGKISTYPQINNESFIFNKKKKEFVVNFRMKKNDDAKKEKLKTFEYIKNTTLKAINIAMNETSNANLNFGFNENDLKKLNDIFGTIQADNLD